MKQDRSAFLAVQPLRGPMVDRSGPVGPMRAGLTLKRQSRASAVAVFLMGVLLVVVYLDVPMYRHAQSLDPNLRALLSTITRLGNSAWPLGVGLAAFVILRMLLPGAQGRNKVALRRVQTCVLLLLGAVAGSGFLASLTKNMIGRARPPTLDGAVFDFSVMAFQPGWASFPSGHATTAMAMMIVLAMMWNRHAVALIMAGGLIALSRCLVGAHWMSDVVAGIALGAVVTLVLRHHIDGGRRRALLSPAMARLAWEALRAGAVRLAGRVMTRLMAS